MKRLSHADSEGNCNSNSQRTTSGAGNDSVLQDTYNLVDSNIVGLLSLRFVSFRQIASSMPSIDGSCLCYGFVVYQFIGSTFLCRRCFHQFIEQSSHDLVKAFGTVNEYREEFLTIRSFFYALWREIQILESSCGRSSFDR